MPANKNTGTPPTPTVIMPPRDKLKDKLIEISMSVRRFSPDQAWMKDALISALDTRLTTQLATYTDEQCDFVLATLGLGK